MIRCVDPGFEERSGLSLNIWLNAKLGIRLWKVSLTNLTQPSPAGAVGSTWGRGGLTRVAKSILEQIRCSSELCLLHSVWNSWTKPSESAYVSIFKPKLKRKINEMKMCFKILELIIGWKSHYWVLCLSGAFVFKRHFTFFLVYYAAFPGVYLFSDCHFTS